MGGFNFFITIGVCAVLLLGAGMTFFVRLSERAEMPLEEIITIKRGEGGRAPLPKWDDKNYKGLVHRP